MTRDDELNKLYSIVMEREYLSFDEYCTYLKQLFEIVSKYGLSVKNFRKAETIRYTLESKLEVD